MTKKSQIGMEFNWIFVLIIGAIILSFFFIIVTNQQKKATIEEAQNLIQKLDTIFTTISSHPDAVEEFNIPHAEIEYTCEPGLSQYYIQGAGPIPSSYDAIATPKLLRGNKIITWTQLWKVPYEATNIINMANDRTIFIFVNTSDNQASQKIISKLWYEMPELFEKKLIRNALDIANDYPEGYDRYVYIFTYSSEDDFNYVRDPVKTSSIEEKAVLRGINENQGVEALEGLGKIAIYNATQPITDFKEQPFLYEPTLWAAIFTENNETYDCTIKKALFKLNITTEILRQRAEQLKKELIGTTCENYLEDSITQFNKIKEATNQGLEGLETIYEAGKKGTATEPSIEKLGGLSLRGYNCPFIY